jgi:hypothetical protein
MVNWRNLQRTNSLETRGDAVSMQMESPVPDLTKFKAKKFLKKCSYSWLPDIQAPPTKGFPFK